MRDFTDEQIKRYSRHIILPEVGGKGQTKLLDSSILIIGAGGLGSPVALYIAAAGVGRIGLVDADTVDLSNLQRQILHHTKDIDTPKVISAQAKINDINSDVSVETYNYRITSKNAMEIISKYDVIIDGSDNFPTKFLLNDVAVLADKPLVHGGILKFVGQVLTIKPHQGACYRCLFKSPPPQGLVPTCQEAGVLGVLGGIIGSIQATEALKLILDIGEPLVNRLMTFDALSLRFREIKVKRNPHCIVCGEKPTITELFDYEQEACQI